MALRVPFTHTAQHSMMADTWISNYFNKSWTVFGVWCEWLGRLVHVAGVCGTLFLWYYNGAHRWFYNASCSDNAPLSTVAIGVLFCVWWTYAVGASGRRAGGIIRLACNVDMTSSIEVCGEWSY